MRISDPGILLLNMIVDIEEIWKVYMCDFREDIKCIVRMIGRVQFEEPENENKGMRSDPPP